MIRVEYSDVGVLLRDVMIGELEAALEALKNGESQISINLGGASRGGSELSIDYNLNLVQIFSEN